MTLTQEPQLGFEEIVVEGDVRMEELLAEWAETLDAAAKNKTARSEINKYAKPEPGIYRYGPYIVTVTNKRKVEVTKPDKPKE